MNLPFFKHKSISQTCNHFLDETQDLSRASKPSKAPLTNHPPEHPKTFTKGASQTTGAMEEEDKCGAGTEPLEAADVRKCKECSTTVGYRV